MPRRRILSEAAPPVLLAVVVNGFWLYLGALELAGVEPRTSITGGYYGLLAVALLTAAWSGRETIRRRLATSLRLPRAWAAVATGLAAWFLVNAALLSSGTTARDAAALLVLSSLPSALVALSLERRQLRLLAWSCVALALGFAVVGFAALLADPAATGRFSPIDDLDPIRTAQIYALAAVVLLVIPFEQRQARLAQAGAAAALVGLSVMPASRGVLLALGFAVVTLGVVMRRHALRVLVPAVAAGLVLGAGGATVVGADYYYSIGVPGLEGRVDRPSEVVHFTGEKALSTGEPTSSLAIRRYLWSKALRDSLDRPILGHGVGMLVDDSPETLQMVREGRVTPNVTTHPHNALIESVYSLGLLGLGLFLAMWALALVALGRILSRGATQFASLFVLALAAFAAVNSMVSGEIGSDALLWIALALPVALNADDAE